MKMREGGIIKDKRNLLSKGNNRSLKFGEEKGYFTVVEPTTEELKEELMQKFNQAISIPDEL